MSDRRQESYAVRVEAAELARSRTYPVHQANGEEQRYAGDQYFMSFTKGLPHNPETGLLQEAQDFVEFRRAIDDGFIDPFSKSVRHGAKFEVNTDCQVVAVPPAEIEPDFRQWEAPTAGVVFELEGPDAQAVTMAPAPPLVDNCGEANPELVLEMAEVYELAVLRDRPFNAFESGSNDAAILDSIARLNNLEYIQNYDECDSRPRKLNAAGVLDAQTVFRGSSPGVEVGPYLSQFLLIGNEDLNMGGSVAEGLITYGALKIDQKVPVAKPEADFMTDMPSYVEVQRGLSPAPEAYVLANGQPARLPERPARRFISTPRDLATYVHYDALYEAYLNACLILLGMGTPFDPAFDHLSGVGAAAGSGKTRRNAGGFALYGGPHILNLVTEVSTRALKAVRFQKFNNHIRLRPEALAARVELVRLADPQCATSLKTPVPRALLENVGRLRDDLEDNGTLAAVRTLITRTAENRDLAGDYFLPMAFPEGSPMHPAYGAGHATVAGACVTILKAFFDTSAVLVETPVNDPKTGETRMTVRFRRFGPGDTAIAFRAPDFDNKTNIAPTDDLVPFTPDQCLTLEGELNKLAANISIGRNMAGVHYFSDYYDSVRMGEEIAIGILEEQALAYSTDPFVLSLPTFDGDVVRIGAR
ncbi:MAG: vanadium-dependent haloperoxidase [Cyanothece sp. SIO2G6]|nr:vanadium-dependent haloperoxidase [Cyanothece sp. SIO2G6]